MADTNKYGLDHFGGKGGVSKMTAKGNAPEDLIEAAETVPELEAVRSRLGDMMMDVESVRTAYSKKMKELVGGSGIAA